MRRYFEASEVFGVWREFNFLTERPYEPIAWAYVERGDPKDPELLVAQKPSGKYVIPGGHIKRNEATLEAAQRECREETGVETVYRRDRRLTKIPEDIIIKPRERAVAVVTQWGSGYGIWVAYRDEHGKPGKRYRCYIEQLTPVDGSEPEEQEDVDVNSPRFMKIGDAIGNALDFTPAVQIFLELAEAGFSGTDILRPTDIVVLPDHRLGQYLKVAEPAD